MNVQRRPFAYLAAPLFSAAELSYNAMITSALEAGGLSVYLPQRDGGLVTELIGTGMEPADAAARVFRGDLEAIEAATVVVAVLDGAAVDDGVAFELGYAVALGKVCVGFLTDSRRSATAFRNPMWSAAVLEICDSVEAVLKRIAGAD